MEKITVYEVSDNIGYLKGMIVSDFTEFIKENNIMFKENLDSMDEGDEYIIIIKSKRMTEEEYSNIPEFQF